MMSGSRIALRSIRATFLAITPLPPCLALFGRLPRRLLRDFCACGPRLGKTDRDRLLAAADLPPRAAALQSAGLALFHRALDLGGCLFRIFSCHDIFSRLRENNLGGQGWFPFLSAGSRLAAGVIPGMNAIAFTREVRVLRARLEGWPRAPNCHPSRLAEDGSHLGVTN